MTFVVFALVSLLAVPVLAIVLGQYFFLRSVARLRARLAVAARPVDVSAQLPPKVREFAVRADASPRDLATCVEITQIVEIQIKATPDWQRMRATQMVAVGATGYLCQASRSLGPLPLSQVIEAHVSGTELRRQLVLGVPRAASVAGAAFGLDAAQRYLTELPRVPDAILGNPAIGWRMVDDTTADAALAVKDQRATVRFRFDAAGDIVQFDTLSHAAMDGPTGMAGPVWRGYYRDYRMVGPRRIPSEFECGPVGANGYHACLQCRMTGYSVLH